LVGERGEEEVGAVDMDMDMVVVVGQSGPRGTGSLFPELERPARAQVSVLLVQGTRGQEACMASRAVVVCLCLCMGLWCVDCKGG